MRRRATVAITLLALASLTGCPSLEGISGVPEKDAAVSNNVDAAAPASDATAPRDSGPVLECNAPAGGQACMPGSVACGNTTCPIPTSVCCMANGTSEEKCTSASACPAPSFKTECDETADCPAGKVCCVAIDALKAQTGASCATTCALGVLSCRSSSECTGTTCKVQQCFGHTVQLCGDLGLICP